MTASTNPSTDFKSICFLPAHKYIPPCTFQRVTVQNKDVWKNLETNWNDFYWLTGETPHTLAALVMDLERNFQVFHESR